MVVAGSSAVSSASLGVAAFGVLVAGLTVLWYVLQQRRNEKTTDTDDARTEALALAETRGKRIDDLEGDIKRLRDSRDEDRANHDREIQSLRKQIAALEEKFADTTRQFGAAQILTAQAAYDTAAAVVEKLEQKPAKTGEALVLLHAYMASFTGTPTRPSR